jgi:PAS domain S-box-containing protein
MDDKNPTGGKSEGLRKRAEKLLKERDGKLRHIPQDIEELIHELQVYQIELEMQNEELRRAQTEIEESRSKYADLYDFSPIGYFTVTRRGIIIEANLTLCNIFGVERRCLLNSPFFLFVKSGFKVSFYRYLQEVFTNGSKHTCELKLMKKNGTEFIASIESIAFRDNKGNSSCRSVMTDITDRKQKEEALRRSEDKYRLLLENLPQRICYKDKNLVYVSCNGNLARDLHIKPDEIKGKTDYDFYPVELATKYRMDDVKVMESGKTGEIDEKYIRDEQKLVIRMVRTPVRDEEGIIIGVLVIFWDITETIALQRESERVRHLAALGELTTGISHEINNPITGIINCAQILWNKSAEGTREKDLARRIIKEGDRITAIVKKLIIFAGTYEEKGQKDVVNIHEILTDTLILTEAQLRKEGINLKLDIPEDLPEIVAYSRQIQQVFLEIINNARDAVNQKYPETHDDKILEISAEETMVDNRPYVKITFLDHGTGIPAAIMDQAVHPFFTTKPRGSRGIGTGLGLSTSHSIIKDHGGKLIIDSIEGKYTRVMIILPEKSESLQE